VAGARVALGSHSRASRRIASRASTAYVITASWNSSRLEFLASRTERFVFAACACLSKGEVES